MQLTPEIRQFIREHQHDDVRVLALQAKKYPDIDMPAAIAQIAGRQAARHKIPSWGAQENIIYPPHLALEQCSSEQTARYKAGLCGGETLVDLTGGFGVDCAFLSAGFGQVVYVERQEELCRIASRNFQTLGLHHITVCNSDSVEVLRQLPPVDCIFVDPARRNEHGGKTVRISDCDPDVGALEELLLQKAGRVMVKLSPMLDLSAALRGLRHTVEVHIVSVQNECKELLLILGSSDREIPIHCINFISGGMQRFVFTHSEESSAEVVFADQIHAYLYEPNASLLKAAAFRSVASRYHLKKLHPNSHLYTSDLRLNDFPGRSFEVKASSTGLKEICSGIHKAHITTRNFPVPVSELRKRTQLADGGDVYLFATTLNNGKKIYIKAVK